MLADRRIHASTPFDEVAGTIGIAPGDLRAHSKRGSGGMDSLRECGQDRFHALYAAAVLT
jgi:hypothetical protein